MPRGSMELGAPLTSDVEAGKKGVLAEASHWKNAWNYLFHNTLPNLMMNYIWKFFCFFSGYTYAEDYYKEGGFVCPSDIYYGRPKRAINTYGKWKVIVNLPGVVACPIISPVVLQLLILSVLVYYWPEARRRAKQLSNICLLSGAI